MPVLGVTVRNFRCYVDARISLGDGLTLISGPNGAGKTNLLEAIYFGCLGRSCRTTNEREVVRFGAESTRVVVATADEDGRHELAVGFAPGEAKRLQVDRAPVERLLDSPVRPLVSVFLPDRLELIKGPPSVRRAHLDQLVAALWPARVATRRAYAQTLAQRNALLGRIRAGGGSRESLRSWNVQLAHQGFALMADRRSAVDEIAPLFARVAQELGLDGEPGVSYKPRSRAASVAELAHELGEREDGDLERGFTGHGPHRDELALLGAGRELRAYGSQGQQRLALLAMLLAERETIGASRDRLPVMLLDDVMSELDPDRRCALIDRLRAGGGQAVITTTDLEYVPGASAADVVRVAVSDGRVLQEAAAA